MILIANDNNPAAAAEVVTEPTQVEVEEAIIELKESLALSIMMLIDNSRERKIPIEPKRNSRTKTTATHMAMNV